MRRRFVLVGLAGVSALAAVFLQVSTRCGNPLPEVGLGVLALDGLAVAFLVAGIAGGARDAWSGRSGGAGQAAAHFLALVGLAVVVAVVLLAELMVAPCLSI